RSRPKAGRAAPGRGAPACLMLKADATNLPLRAASVSLVIATPPHLGVKRFGAAGFCTRDSQEYERMLRALKAQCLRVLEPHGHLVLYVREGGSRIRKVFDVFQKRRQAGRWRLAPLRAHVFRVPYILVPGFWWWALPVAFYRKLIARYSAPGGVVAHIFSGSGHGGTPGARLGRPACPLAR